jgi:hypothetical protein
MSKKTFSHNSELYNYARVFILQVETEKQSLLLYYLIYNKIKNYIISQLLNLSETNVIPTHVKYVGKITKAFSTLF